MLLRTLLHSKDDLWIKFLLSALMSPVISALMSPVGHVIVIARELRSF